MNNKKLLLLSILTLATATMRPEQAPEISQPEVCVKQTTIPCPWDFFKMYASSVVPGIAVGGFTGTAIGYLSGTFFDAIMNKEVIETIINNRRYDETKYIRALITLARLGTQLGCKYYWEKPLRNKIMNWVLADIKNHSVTCNEELTKTIARVSAYIGTATQLKLS